MGGRITRFRRIDINNAGTRQFTKQAGDASCKSSYQTCDGVDDSE